MTKFFTFFKSNPRPFLSALILALLSGILTGTTYIPFKGWFLLFCYAPLWLATRQMMQIQNAPLKTSMKRIFMLGWVTQFVLTLIGFNWIYYVASEFGQLHWSLSFSALLLFAAFMHLYIPFSLVLAFYLIHKFKIREVWLHFLIMALCLSFLERVWPSIFEWNLAYTLLWINAPLFQWADTVGFWGLSTWILVFQAVVTYCFSIWKTDRATCRDILLSYITLALVLNLFGLMKEKKWSHFDQSVQFTLVQGNVGNLDKIQSEKAQGFQAYILGLYTNLTTEHLKTNSASELIIWPETAMPFALDPYFLNRPEQQNLLAQVTSWNKPLITGGYSVDLQKKDHLGNPLLSNSVFYIGPTGQLIGETYNKTDLLVFGEYMPFGQYVPFLYKLLPFVGAYKVGPGPSVQDLTLKNKTVRLGPQICYESLNPGFSRGLATKGAQILFNVTNDSWFGWWAEPFQHQIMTLARAVEVRRPLVRSTNTGISSVILANGKILENSPLQQAWAQTYDVPYLEKAPLSFYTKWGHWDWIVWLVLMMGFILKYRNKEPHVHD